MSVDEYMTGRGFASTSMGYLGAEQKKQFLERLRLYPEIKSIAEIGFNAGHSAECFFEGCLNLTKFVSFDINYFPYTKPMSEYFQARYASRFFFVEGNSCFTVPLIARSYPHEKFDLIYIDGAHGFQEAVVDILNCLLLAHDNTILWIDDLHYPNVSKAVEFCEQMGWICLEAEFQSEEADGLLRSWGEARYRLP